MRSSQKSGRSRGKGNRGKTQGHSPNRVYESAGPEGKVRGTPQQIIDKYLALARDAQLSGDRVGSENFLQHAEHYARILIAAQEAQDAQRDRNQQQNNNNNNNNQNRQDDDQPSAQGGGQGGGGGGQQQPRNDRNNDDFGDDDQPSSDGLEAIGAAQDGPEIVETPESKSNSTPKPRTRRPRPKPPAEPAAETKGDDDTPAKVEAAE